MRPRDPRRLLERQRRAGARVAIVRVEQPGASGDGAVGSKQVAEVTLPREELERIWSPEYLERLARTYWSFLSRFSLGLIRVLYSEDSREVVFLTRPFVLLRFHKPEYEIDSDGGTVTWPIDRGVLVAKRGRGRGFLRLGVRREPVADDAEEVTLLVSSEVVNFYPTIATGLSGWLYEQTQLRIHVIVTHAFLRSLANLDLEPSSVGALRAAAEPRRRRSAQALASDLAELRAVVARVDPADGARAGAHRDRLGGRAAGADVVDAVEHLPVRHTGGGEEDVIAGHEPVLVERLLKVVAGLERRSPFLF